VQSEYHSGSITITRLTYSKQCDTILGTSYQPTPIRLTAEQKAVLASWIRSPPPEPRMVFRSKTAMTADDGMATAAIAAQLETRIFGKSNALAFSISLPFGRTRSVKCLKKPSENHRRPVDKNYGATVNPDRRCQSDRPYRLTYAGFRLILGRPIGAEHMLLWDVVFESLLGREAMSAVS
jgi:hypothetical protein